MAIEILPESEGNVLATKAVGKLTDDDYKDTFLPKIEEIIAAHESVRILFYMDADFEGWDAGVIWADAKFGLQHMGTALRGGFQKIAVVGGKSWVGKTAELSGYLMRGEVKAYEQNELDQAMAWVKA